MATRASDADRSDVAEQLRESAAEGRLTIDELSDRISEVMEAKTYLDLHRCLRELPEYDKYKPWQKVRANEVQFVTTTPPRRRRLRIRGPIVVGLIGLFFIKILSGIIFGFFLFPLRIVLFIAIATIIFRLFRFYKGSQFPR